MGRRLQAGAEEMVPEANTEEEEEPGLGQVLAGDLLREVFKYLDARSLCRSACVNREWRKAADDGRLWEKLCLQHWPKTACRNNQLRSVVMALGGFKSLYFQSLRPLLYPSCSIKNVPSNRSVRGLPPPCWGKDEVHLSLSLFSIHCYESINSSSALDNLSLQAAQHPIFQKPEEP
eukprot:TRINITY_DN7548_c0_g1_i1.p1 TRINITY_DN7548_c0_g1~~TRINITY_DN7548_c0_g1_i1.p1  ORF type:complete len:176 (+),score=23.60 TRINITY_DN7548_c0_g1_i1:194-721(+)